MCRVFITWAGGFVFDVRGQASLLRKQQFLEWEKCLKTSREHESGSRGHHVLCFCAFWCFRRQLSRSRVVFQMGSTSKDWVLLCVEGV